MPADLQEHLDAIILKQPGSWASVFLRAKSRTAVPLNGNTTITRIQTMPTWAGQGRAGSISA